MARKVNDVTSDTAVKVKNQIDSAKGLLISARFRCMRIKGFRDGIKQGTYLVVEKRYNFICAYVATFNYFLRCDGDFSKEEQAWLNEGLSHLKLDNGLSDDMCSKIESIATDEDMTFDDVKEYLDQIGLMQLDDIADRILIAAEVDG